MMQSHHIILITRVSEGGSSAHGVILFKLLDVILEVFIEFILRRCNFHLFKSLSSSWVVGPVNDSQGSPASNECTNQEKVFVKN